jgi:transposase
MGKERLTEKFTLRLTSRQLGRIQARAAHEHRSPGDWVRRAIADLMALEDEQLRLSELRTELLKKQIDLDRQEARILSL